MLYKEEVYLNPLKRSSWLRVSLCKCVIILLTTKKEQNRIGKHRPVIICWNTEDYRQYQNRLINSQVSRTIFSLMCRSYLLTLNTVKILVNGAKWESCFALSNKTKQNPSKEWPAYQKPETASPYWRNPSGYRRRKFYPTQGRKQTAKICCQCSINHIEMPLKRSWLLYI